MFLQIFIGSAIMMVTVTLAGIAAWIMEWAFSKVHFWLLREPHRPKLLVVVVVVALWALTVVTMGGWIWAGFYRALGVFPTLETAVYFSLVSYTTLGYGDVILPNQWRILGGMTGASGFLNFGLMTAMLVEALRHVRLGQLQAHRHH